MATAEHVDLRKYSLDVARRALAASQQLATVSGDVKQRWLRRACDSAARAW